MAQTGVESVRRALLILKSFDRSGDSLTLTEISERTGLYKSTVLRLALSLEAEGFLVRLSGKAYALGAEVMRLGAAYQRSLRLEDHVRPVLQHLASKTGESSSFYTRVGEGRLCLFREHSHHILRDHISEGEILTVAAGATWHVLTQFDDTKDKAALHARMARLPFRSVGERDAETAALAVPVFRLIGGETHLAGALSVSGPRSRMLDEMLERIAPDLLSAGRDLSLALGGGAPWN